MQWFFRLFGIGLILGGILLLLRISGLFSPENTSVTGVITGSQSVSTGRGGSLTTLVAPVIMFKTKDGSSITVTDTTSDMGYYHVGQQVPVLYNASNPQDARISSFVFLSSYSLAVVALIGFGVLFLLAGRTPKHSKVRVARRRRPKQRTLLHHPT
jgi:hypothetical protein